MVADAGDCYVHGRESREQSHEDTNPRSSHVGLEAGAEHCSSAVFWRGAHRLPRRHAQTDRELDGTRSVCAEKVSLPDGAHVLRDAELLRYISAIFFDIHLREV